MGIIEIGLGIGNSLLSPELCVPMTFAHNTPADKGKLNKENYYGSNRSVTNLIGLTVRPSMTFVLFSGDSSQSHTCRFAQPTLFWRVKTLFFLLALHVAASKAEPIRAKNVKRVFAA